MGLLSVLNVAFPSKNMPSTLYRRLLAWTNIVGFGYFVMMICVVTTLGLVEVLPTVCSDSALSKHYGFVLFLFLNVMGNCWNVYRTDTSITTLPRVIHSRSTLGLGTTTPRPSDKSNDIILGATCATEAQDDISAKPDTEHFRGHFLRTVCKVCKVAVARRSHHCALCGVCILKRDHHCFFLCSCIGYHNQKYFIMFCCYMSITAFYICHMGATYFNLIYNTSYGFPVMPLTLLPSVLVRGAKSGYQMTLVGLFYGCFGGGMASLIFFVKQIRMTLLGRTTHEMRTGTVIYSRSCWENFLDVFGPHWYLTLFVPVSLPQLGIGLYEVKHA